MNNKRTNVGVGLDQPAKDNRGITLIALITTIIVMLILVSVTINAAVNSGLFGHAQKQETNMDGDVDKYTGTKEHNWKRTGDNINCEHCELSFVIGDYVDYKPDTTSKTVTVTKEEAGLLELSRTSSSTIDPITVSDQTFTQDANTYWQVLGVEDSDKNGTNETLLIKMAFGTSEELYLKGASAYNNGPEIMNRICKELYSSSKYGEARSINITDVNNTLQYTPGGGQYKNGTDWVETSGFNTEIKDLPMWDAVKARGTYTPDGTNTEAKLGSYKVDGYDYYLIDDKTVVDPDVTGGVVTNITANTRDIIFKTPEGDKYLYWLACRGVSVYDDYAVFCLGGLIYVGGTMCLETFNSLGYVFNNVFPVAPVVPLRCEIPAKITTPSFSEPI